MSEGFEVRMRFKCEVEYLTTAILPWREYQRLENAIKRGEPVDLYEYAEWANPVNVSDSRVVEFGLAERRTA